ncbi:hypothetical protein BGZ99_010356 [Dissophora globulifera]|uniref:Uncharacterized protein n=1 Tax=Dissophora globulifera TaxID=979702 RepID=A0A9P6R2K0_9FUNG|nr:hypothetical protein BGZ99_010356 [Dissophora globulifera]
MFSRVRRTRSQPYDQTLQRRLDDALKKCQKWEMAYQDIHSRYTYQRDMAIELNNDMSILREQNRNIMEENGHLEHTNTDLLQQYDDLRHRYDRKVESFKELDKNYMDLVRPLLVTNDDPSTIYNRLMKIRVSIEHLVQKAKGDRSINLQREAALEHFRSSGLLQVFPVKESLLEPYHLNLYIESAIMMVLIHHLFVRPLGCHFDKYKEFQEIRVWMNRRDRKLAIRWRQQLCILVAQDGSAMAHGREEGVSEAARVIVDLISTVYSHEDMSAKIKELCYNTFDLSFAMFGMESMIFPMPIRLGIPFDNEVMTTPQKSNPEGSVSLVIFPAFQDADKNFYLKPKVWCH